MWNSFFYYVGCYSVICYLFYHLKSPFQIAKSIIIEKLYPWTRKSLVERYGDWAVITGSSDGIGEEYAKELARHGFNIVLISRTKAKLMRVASEIEQESNVKTKCIPVDFTKGKEIYEYIKKELTDIQVGVLVNNVGMAPSTPSCFDGHSEQLLWDMIQVDMSAMTMMTRIILDDMKLRGRGAIVNISSLSRNAPLMKISGMYCSCKSFCSMLTMTLQWELAEYKDISIQLLEPGFIATKLIDFSESLQSHALTADVKDFAKTAVFTLGRTEFTTGNLKHSLLSAATTLLPLNLRIYLNLWLSKHYSIIE